eukprot:329677-Amphidinium_carterae.1
MLFARPGIAVGIQNTGHIVVVQSRVASRLPHQGLAMTCSSKYPTRTPLSSEAVGKCPLQERAGTFTSQALPESCLCKLQAQQVGGGSVSTSLGEDDRIESTEPQPA